ncbi:MAG: DUF2341 domain-containing protein, partial [Kiritimatiellae bacterium]|nr:DUF2341 domain-containing protein [Kiritimatiellia bacterium]
MKQRWLACLGLAACISYSVARGDAAWLDDFGFRRLLTVTNLAAIGSAQTDFPILVKFTEANFSFQNANVDGHDVRFTAADGTTPLSFERERHTAGAAEYWVKLPALASDASTSFYVYYRLADAADASDPTNVWDSNYRYVHHFEETSGLVYDSTANAVTGTPVGVTLGASGMIGSGVLYDSSGSSYIWHTNKMVPSKATFEVWYKPSTIALYNMLLCWQNYDGSSIYYITPTASSNLYAYLYAAGTGFKYDLTGTNRFSVGNWHYVAAVYGAAAPTPRQFYMNGVLDATDSAAVIPHGVGAYRQYLGYRAGGILDEIRLSTTARSADWIRAQDASMRDQLLSYGAEEKGQRIGFLADYDFRRLITVTNLAAIPSTLANFPVRVSLTPANFSFNLSNPNGYDIRFTAADGITPLSFEREKHDQVAETAEYWVKLPMLAAGSPTEFYVYHRLAATADGADPTNVWDSDYCFVHHFEETSGSVYDSTVNAVTGTPGSVTLGASGMIGSGALYASTGNSLIQLVKPVAKPVTGPFEV